MALSYVTYTGDGSTTSYPVPFPYLFQSDVAVTVNGSAVSFSWTNTALVHLAVAPASGSTLLIARHTNLTALDVVFVDGSTVEASDINTAELQSLYLDQELSDGIGVETARAEAAEAALQQQILGLTLPSGASLASFFTAFLASLPTTPPVTHGVAWLDGGVVAVS